MAHLSNVELEGKMNNSKKGFGQRSVPLVAVLAVVRVLFMTHAKGLSDGAYLGIAPFNPGKVKLESDK